MTASKLLTLPPLHDYQEQAVKWILDNPYCGLLLDMGLGKTRSTLEALSRMDPAERGKVLIVAPLAVARNTWPAEIKKWGYDFSYTVICGEVNTPSAAVRGKLLTEPTDIHIINRENIPWLYDQWLPHAWPYRTVVLDELSSFKSHQAKKFKAMRAVRPYINRVIGLTGTPAPSGLIDLWAQVYLLDQGARLGKFITHFRERYFFPKTARGKIVYKWAPHKSSEDAIFDAIGDICLSMRARDKLLTLPPRTDNIVPVYLDPKEQADYDRLEKEYILDATDPYGEDLGTITAVHAGALVQKLIQLANGSVYGDPGIDGRRPVLDIHHRKSDALADLLDEQQGNPTLVFYWFRHDMAGIERACDKAGRSLSFFDGSPAMVEQWNDGDLEVVALHPASAGHGLNLQDGGHTGVWYSLTYDLEKYQQANARIDRQGQKNPVIIHHLVTQGTKDIDVMEALESKTSVQDTVMNALRREAGLPTPAPAEWVDPILL